MKYIVSAVALFLVVAVVARAWILANLNDFEDPMLNAARDGDVSGLRELLANGADANRSDAYGNTPLSIAAHFGQTEAADLLITHGAAIEGSGNGEMTPLQCAVYSRHPKTAACLLSHNADPNADNPGGSAQDSEHDSHLGWRSATLPNQGNTPLAIAKSNGFTEIIELLEEHGAK